MATREEYISLGVSGYEHEGCWRKAGIFHIRMQAPRLACRRCEQVLNAVLPHVVPRCNSTKDFARHVVDLRKMMSIRDVVRYMGVSDTMIQSIDKKYLQQKFGKPRLRDLEIMAIDEIYVGKKHYLKEDLGLIWQQSHKLAAGAFLADSKASTTSRRPSRVTSDY